MTDDGLRCLPLPSGRPGRALFLLGILWTIRPGLSVGPFTVMHISPGDILLPFTVILLLFERPPSGRLVPSLALLYSSIVLASTLLSERPGAGIEGAMRIYAASGAALVLTLAGRDGIETVTKGLMIGVLLQALLLPVHLLGLPGSYLLDDGGGFAGLTGGGNCMALISGALALIAASPLALPLLLLVLASGSRTGLLFTGLLLMARRGRAIIFVPLGLAAAAAALLLLPIETITASDRWFFTSHILSRASEIPPLGTGPGRGFGLDNYAKTYLDIGPLGLLSLLALLAPGIYRAAVSRPVLRGLTPVLFLLLYGLAHETIRWPWYFLLLLGSAAPRPTPQRPSTPAPPIARGNRVRDSAG